MERLILEKATRELNADEEEAEVKLRNESEEKDIAGSVMKY
jgi:hypothetical protein